MMACAANAVAQTPTITTYAGPPVPVSGTSAVTQAIDTPIAIAGDGSGGIFVVSESQNRVYHVDAAGTLMHVAGSGADGFAGDGAPATSAAFASPFSVAVDGAGNLFIADFANHRVRKVNALGVISTVAGVGFPDFRGDGGLATAARLNLPTGVAVDAAGNLYIADRGNDRVRKVGPDGIISTVAGNGTLGIGGDGGPATAAQLSQPIRVAVDSAGNLFIADSANNRVRKVSPDGIISTVAGTGSVLLPGGFGGDGGPAVDAQLNYPDDVEVDAAGNLFIADLGNHRVRKVAPDGIITTVAGTGVAGYGGDGGPASAARITNPRSVDVDAAGNLYIGDWGNHRVRMVNPQNIMSTVAGTAISGFAAEDAPASGARLAWPGGLTVDADGNLLIGDTSNHRVRRITAQGIISTVAGDGTSGSGGDGGPATAAQLNFPYGVAVDGSGNLLIADTNNHRIRMVTSGHVITTLAGTGAPGFSGDGGPATSAQLRFPVGVAVDRSGNVFVGDAYNHRIRKIAPDGTISTVAGTGEMGDSGDGGPATAARLSFPQHVAVDAAGNLFIADAQSHRIKKVAANGIISTIAGLGLPGYRGDGGPATAARFTVPTGVAVDAANNVYVADQGNSAIRKVTPDGVIRAFAGVRFPGFSGDGGPAAGARVSRPYAIVVDPLGDLFIADTINHRIRVVRMDTDSHGFTDHPLRPRITTVRSVHITELRARIDSLRAAKGLPSFTWTDPAFAAGSTIRAVHVAELRTALVQAYQSAAVPVPMFTDPDLGVGVIAIRAVHITELRAAVVALE